MRSILKNERLICLRKISRNENERWFLLAMRSFLNRERVPLSLPEESAVCGYLK